MRTKYEPSLGIFLERPSKKVTEQVWNVNECNAHVQMETPETHCDISRTRCCNGFPQTMSRFAIKLKAYLFG